MVCNAIARFFLCISAYHDDKIELGEVGMSTELSWQIGYASESFVDPERYSEGVYTSVVSESSH